MLPIIERGLHNNNHKNEKDFIHIFLLTWSFIDPLARREALYYLSVFINITLKTFVIHMESATSN